MKNLMLVAAGAITLLSACGGGGTKSSADSAANADKDTALAVHSNSTASLDVHPISGYFVKNTIKVSDSLTFWVIDNQRAFDSLFGVAKTMSNKPDIPDFGTQIVVAAAMPATFYGTQIQLASAVSNDKDNGANLHFAAPAEKEKKSFSIVPLWLGSIPKTGKSTINFYTGDHLSQTIKVNE
ncbi:MAG TPA: hypothetical protein VM802_26715 [Chitinophaga sp.]|uniref:hypothetical protein n=1 Tax=Chitinophaga sp. TaxID=1869181 RepID=UPI002C99BA85|nr:hypothetical protein [Chitinophaga sp.]HVI48489.1 hypothetical protein [Chitinophaga sp.]